MRERNKIKISQLIKPVPVSTSLKWPFSLTMVPLSLTRCLNTLLWGADVLSKMGINSLPSFPSNYVRLTRLKFSSRSQLLQFSSGFSQLLNCYYKVFFFF